MRKLILISCLLLVVQAPAFDAGRCCCCKRGPTGPVGPAGPQGPAGQPSNEINDVMEVTNSLDNLAVGNAIIPFSSPIVYPVNGVDVPLLGGMALVESVPASGNFDTITLPIETADTFYQVNYGVGIMEQTEPVLELEFQLVVNGIQLPYTTIGINSSRTRILDGTSVIVNPANVAGTLSLLSLNAATILTTSGENSFSAYVTLVKLNNNAP